MNKEKAVKELVPELRFPEFKGRPSWLDGKLGEAPISTFSTKKISLSKISKETYLSTENLLPNFGGVVSAEKLPKSGSFTEFESGDILLSNIRPYFKKLWQAEYSGSCSNDVIVIKPGSLIDSDFLYQSLSNDHFFNYVMKGAKGVKMPRGDIDQIKNYDVTYPSSEEQTKIADCLDSIDQLIEAHTNKLKTLENYKKGLMQQLFPAAGQSVPALRFPEFRDGPEWQPRLLKDVFNEVPRPIIMSDDQEYSLVTVKRRYGGVVSRGILKGSEIKVKSQFLVEENDFLISKRQIVHCACGLVPKSLEGSIVSNEYSVLRTNPGFDLSFINYFSQQSTVSQSFLQCSIGIVIEKMLFKLNEWMKKEFLFPSEAEQKKIAQVLSNTENMINETSEKLEHLKAHKKGLMLQLFPAMD
jgi:type I restriction enzyme, S subunit